MSDEPQANENKPVAPEGRPDMLEIARARAFDTLEAEWMARLETPPEDADEFLRVADYLVRRKFPEKAELLLWSLIASVAEARGPREALALAKRAAACAPESATLREETASLYRRVYSGVQELDGVIESSGLLKAQPLDSCLRFIENCLRLRPGAYVLHVRSRRPGRVIGFRDGAYVVESEGREQALSPLDLPNFWEPAPPDDLSALLVYEKDRLRQMAREDPTTLIVLVARLFKGAAELKQVKQVLIPTVLSEADWSAWWNGVKVELRRCPLLDVSGKAQPVFTLREKGRGYSDKVRGDFAAAPDALAKVGVVRDYLAEAAAGHEADETLAVELASALAEMAAATPDPAKAIALLATAGEVRARFPAVPDTRERIAARLAAVGTPGALIADLKDEIARLVLAAVKDASGDRWPALFAEIFPSASSRLCDAIARDLLDAGREDLLTAAADTAVTLPEPHAEALAWVWRQVLAGDPVLSRHFDTVSVTAVMLHLANRLARVPRHAENREEARQKLSRLRNVLGAGDFRLLRDLIAQVDLENARRLRRALVANEALTGHDAADLARGLESRFPEEFAEKKELWEDGNIYSSADALARRHAEVDRLVNEEMPRVARAIGAAAEKGDLRENWEYKSALEERDRLVERITRAREELDRAHVIDPAAVTGEAVNVGTAVLLRETATGRERRVVFLGPWDADIPHGVYSYLAPVSRKFLGRRPGDRVTASFGDAETEHEIVAIEKIV